MSSVTLINTRKIVGNVNSAFRSFLKDHVNLDPETTRSARGSRSWLYAQIRKFDDDANFPQLYPEYDIAYGSFARRTKKQPLDDIDMMVCLHAQGATYDPDAAPHQIGVNMNSNLARY